MTTPTNDGGPAFPLETGATIAKGMSLRDWFAGMALARLQQLGLDDNTLASACYQIADALLAERDALREQVAALKEECVESRTRNTELAVKLDHERTAKNLAIENAEHWKNACDEAVAMLRLVRMAPNKRHREQIDALLEKHKPS